MRQAVYSIRIFILIAWPVLSCSELIASERISGFSTGDTVTIHSIEAWEDEKPDIIHFSGGFELNATDWYVTADTATLYGKLDDPETAVLTGSPAAIMVNTESKGQIQTITAEAERITYLRDTNSLRMEGTASITRDDITMLGGKIEYDIEQDRISASGDEGVSIRLKHLDLKSGQWEE
jgi:lipopolysaccharide transport protein LptA